MIKNKYKSLRFSIFITRYLQFFIFIFSIYNTFLLNAVFSQSKHNSFNSDSSKTINKNYTYLDSLKLVIAEVVIMGNDVTDDEIILREMQLRKGNVFTSEKCEEDRLKINNLGLFVRTEITPDLKPENKLLLKVNVQEKWYIYPMPSAGSVDGDIRKIWVGASIRWQNFRGRNENQTPGTYEVEWDASNYPSGVYFYRITISDPETPARQSGGSSGFYYSETKKLILLK